MKKNILLFTLLFGFMLNISAQESIIKDTFEQFAQDKIEKMQKLIGFDDKQAEQLMELELNFLLDVNAAENYFWCKSKKRIEKLKVKKEEQLKEILDHNQHIKYDAIDNSKIKRHPMWLK